MTITHKLNCNILLLFIGIIIAPSIAWGCTWWSIYTGSGHDDNSMVLKKHLLKFQSDGAQPDGWAYVGYTRQNEKQILKYRSKLSSAQDPSFNEKISTLIQNKPKISVVHNWLHVTGPTGIPNPYPHLRYKHGKWYSLGDNGVTNMPKLFRAIEKSFLSKNPITYGQSIKNYQMGELWLLLILQEIEKSNGNSEIGFIRAIRKMGKFINASLVFSDGTRLWCYTDSMGLYYHYDKRKNYTIITSGATSDDALDWTRINGGQKILITMDHKAPKVMHIDSYEIN